MIRFRPLIFILTSVISNFCHAQTINTVAGTGDWLYNGTDLLPLETNLNLALMTSLTNGGLLISDYFNVVRKLSVNGEFLVFAGNLQSGPNQDGVPATTTAVSPRGLFTDTAGNVLICEPLNNRVRKVAVDGTITTIAGTGAEGFSGMGGLATEATIRYPDHITMDNLGNIYFTLSNNDRICKIDTNGIITLFAWTGVLGYNGDGIPAATAKLAFPQGICSDSENNIYFTEYFGHRIRKINTAGIISTVAGTGSAGYNGNNLQAHLAKLNRPLGLKYGADGDLYFADVENHWIRKINLITNIISNVAGTGAPGFSGDGGAPLLAQLDRPTEVELSDDGTLYKCDRENARIRAAANFLSTQQEDFEPNPITMLPNPSADGYVNLSFPDGTEEITVFNISGQQVLSENTVSEKTFRLYLEKTGVYFVRFGTGARSIIKKLIIAK